MGGGKGNKGKKGKRPGGGRGNGTPPRAPQTTAPTNAGAGGGKAAKNGKGKGVGNPSQSQALPGPRTPLWKCTCGHALNWASMLLCYSCGKAAPPAVSANAYAKAAQITADKAAKVGLQQNQNSTSGVQVTPVGEISEQEFQDCLDNMEPQHMEVVTNLRTHLGEEAGPLVKQFVSKIAATTDTKEPYQRNLREALVRQERGTVKLQKAKQALTEATEAATAAAQQVTSCQERLTQSEKESQANSDEVRRLEHDSLYGGLPDQQIKGLEEAASAIDEAASAEVLQIKRNIEAQVAQLKQVVASQEEAKAKERQEALERAAAAKAAFTGGARTESNMESSHHGGPGAGRGAPTAATRPQDLPIPEDDMDDDFWKDEIFKDMDVAARKRFTEHAKALDTWRSKRQRV